MLGKTGGRTEMAKLAACSPNHPSPIKWTIKRLFQLDIGVCSEITVEGTVVSS